MEEWLVYDGKERNLKTSTYETDDDVLKKLISLKKMQLSHIFT
jgi:hypothetical protein